MRFSTDRSTQLSVDQLLQRPLQQFSVQIPNPITTKLFDQLQQAAIMDLGHRASPLEFAGDEFAEGRTAVLPRH
jgi:hypothetical protein